MSLVLPMETLPHWPEVAEPSVLQMIGVILGVPILLGLLIVLLGWVPNLMRMGRGGRHAGGGALWVNPGSKRTAGIDTDVDSAPYTMGQREELIRTVRRAEQVSGLDVSLYVGPPEGQPAEDFAIDLLDSLPDPERSLLLYWDPAAEQAEFVTGDETDRVLTASDIAQARAEVDASAELGTPVDGLVRALDLLSQHARGPEALHGDPSLAVNA